MYTIYRFVPKLNNNKFRSLVSGVSQECSLALAHAMVAEVPRHPPSHVLDNLPEIGG